MDPDYDGYCIGGWSGTIIAFETWEQMPMALIEWDASTQRDRLDPEVRRRAASQGLSVAQMCSPGIKGLSHPPRPGRHHLVVIAIPMCCGFATRCELMGRLCGLPIVAIAVVPRSPFRPAFWPRSCALNSKPQALWRGLRRMRLRPCVSVKSDAGIGVRVPGHGGSGGGGAKWYVRGHLLASEPGYLSPSHHALEGTKRWSPIFFTTNALCWPSSGSS